MSADSHLVLKPGQALETDRRKIGLGKRQDGPFEEKQYMFTAKVSQSIAAWNRCRISHDTVTEFGHGKGLANTSSN